MPKASLAINIPDSHQTKPVIPGIGKHRENDISLEELFDIILMNVDVWTIKDTSHGFITSFSLRMDYHNLTKVPKAVDKI